MVKGTVHQQAAQVRFRRYTCGCVLLAGAAACLALGGIMPRSAEIGLIQKYRSRIISDDLDDPLPDVSATGSVNSLLVHGFGGRSVWAVLSPFSVGRVFSFAPSPLDWSGSTHPEAGVNALRVETQTACSRAAGALLADEAGGAVGGCPCGWSC